MKKMTIILLSMLCPLLQAKTNITVCQVFAEHVVGDQHKNVSINQPCKFTLESSLIDVTVLEENEAYVQIKVQLTEGNTVYPASEISAAYGEPVAIGTTWGNSFGITIDKQ